MPYLSGIAKSCWMKIWEHEWEKPPSVSDNDCELIVLIERDGLGESFI